MDFFLRRPPRDDLFAAVGFCEPPPLPDDLSDDLPTDLSLAAVESFEDVASDVLVSVVLASLPSLPFSSLPFSSFDFESDSFESVSLVSLVSFGASSARSARLRWLSLSPLKSVSYQP